MKYYRVERRIAFTMITLPARNRCCEVQYLSFLETLSLRNPSISWVSSVIPKGAPRSLEIEPGGAQVRSKLLNQAGFGEAENQYPTLFRQLMNKPEAEPKHLSKEIECLRYSS